MENTDTNQSYQAYNDLINISIASPNASQHTLNDSNALMDSTAEYGQHSPTSTSNNYELENQFILRFPTHPKDPTKAHEACDALKEALASGADLADRLQIDLNPESRLGSLRFDTYLFRGRLVDLPCIIESLKTVDKKSFYKTADISQMFVCRTPGDESADEPLASDSDNPDAAKKFLWLHGITPPLKNVRRKRFRKVASKKIIDYVEVEKEVKRLFKADRDAVKVEHEVLYVDEEKPSDDNKHKAFDLTLGEESSLLNATDLNSPMMMMSVRAGARMRMNQADSSNDAMNVTSRSEKEFVEQVIGDLSSSEESDAENNMYRTKKRESFEMMDIGDESTNLDAPSTKGFSAPNDEDSNMTSMFENEGRGVKTSNLLGYDLSSSSSDESNSESVYGSASKVNELNEKLSKLHEELDVIRLRKKKQEDEINHIGNPVLKGRLLPVLNEIIEEERLKTAEIEEVKAMLAE